MGSKAEGRRPTGSGAAPSAGSEWGRLQTVTSDPAGRPSPRQLHAARGRKVADLVRPGTPVLLCGINPSLWSAAVGLHFANPTNRLWAVLAASGWTPRPLSPSETGALLACGLGITNLVARATARADELAAGELRAGLPRVAELATGNRVQWVAFLGLAAYRTAAGDRRARVGRQDRPTGSASTWLLPNPSGLNATWQLPALADAYAALRREVGQADVGSARHILDRTS